MGTAFIEIVRFIPLPQAEAAIHRGGQLAPITEVFTLTSECVSRMLQQENMRVDIEEALLMTLLERVSDYPVHSAIQLPAG